MTAGSTIKWMSDRGYKDRWLVQQNDVNVNSTRYHRRPVGNSPEIMPLGNSLNADIKWLHNRHVGMTRHLPDADPHKFCNCTPKSIAHGIKRLVESTDIGHFQSERVIQGYDRLLDAMRMVYEANGYCFRVGRQERYVYDIVNQDQVNMVGEE